MHSAELLAVCWGKPCGLNKSVITIVTGKETGPDSKAYADDTKPDTPQGPLAWQRGRHKFGLKPSFAKLK